MSIIYDLKEVPGQEPDQEQPLLHPYIVSSGTIPSRKILKEICEASTFTVPDLEGALFALSEHILQYLNDGYRVELGHFGYFSPTLKTVPPVRDRKNIRANALSLDSINFRPSAGFRKGLHGKFKRASPGQGHRTSSNLSDEECLQRLMAYLEKHPFITRLDYSALTGKLKNTAIKQLKFFVSEGLIASTGSRDRVVYVLPTRE